MTLGEGRKKTDSESDAIRRRKSNRYVCYSTSSPVCFYRFQPPMTDFSGRQKKQDMARQNRQKVRCSPGRSCKVGVLFCLAQNMEITE